MSTFKKMTEEVPGVGIRFHDHQDDNGDCDGDDEATIAVMMLSSTSLDMCNMKIHNTSSSSSLFPSCPRDRNYSITSYTTECTTNTTRISNTTSTARARARRRTATTEKDKNKKRFFLLFVKILMKLIEEKDDTNIIYQNAKAVVRDCEQRKERGEIESFVKSLYAPLKETVGIQYWNEARQLLHHSSQNNNNNNSNINTMSTTIYTRNPLSTLCQSTSSMTMQKCNRSAGNSRESNVTATTNNNNNINFNINKNNGNNKEMNIRNKRLWMIISIFMQYLERKDMKLYMKARSLINECVDRHKSSKYNNAKYSTSSTTSTSTSTISCTSTSTSNTSTSLSGSIQSCLKKNIGADYWRRAESYVAKALLMKHYQNYNNNQIKIKNVVLPGNTTTDVERIITDHHPISPTIIRNHRRVSVEGA